MVGKLFLTLWKHLIFCNYCTLCLLTNFTTLFSRLQSWNCALQNTGKVTAYLGTADMWGGSPASLTWCSRTGRPPAWWNPSWRPAGAIAVNSDLLSTHGSRVESAAWRRWSASLAPARQTALSWRVSSCWPGRGRGRGGSTAATGGRATTTTTAVPTRTTPWSSGQWVSVH